jgi:predicted MFS family arabinose efflux permease
VLGVGYAISLAGTAWMVVPMRNLSALLVARSLASLAFCTTFTINGAEAFEVVPGERRVGGLAILGVSGILSSPVGTYLGERLLAADRPAWVFAVSGLALGAAFALAMAHRWHVPDPEAERPHLVRIAVRPRLRGLIALALTLGGAFSVHMTYLANLTSEVLGSVRISVFYTSYSLMAVGSRLLLASVLDRANKIRLATICFSCTATSFLMATLLPPRGGLLLVFAGLAFGIGHALLFPLLMSLFVGTGNEQEKLELNSIFVTTMTLGGVLITVAVGALGDLFGTRAIFAATIGICAMAAALSRLAIRPALLKAP